MGSTFISFTFARSMKNALPLIVTHGWPGSVIEQLKIIDPLTNPTAHGGERVGRVPSRDSVDAGLRVFRQADRRPAGGPSASHAPWIALMKRLGYTKFVAQGGDWGALIVDLMGVQAPPELLGIHTNMAGAVPPEIDKAAFTGAPPPSDLSAEEKHAYDQLAFFYQTRPRLRSGDGEPPADAVRDCGFARRPGRLDTRP